MKKQKQKQKKKKHLLTSQKKTMKLMCFFSRIYKTFGEKNKFLFGENETCQKKNEPELWRQRHRIYEYDCEKIYHVLRVCLFMSV